RHADDLARRRQAVQTRAARACPRQRRRESDACRARAGAPAHVPLAVASRPRRGGAATHQDPRMTAPSTARRSITEVMLLNLTRDGRVANPAVLDRIEEASRTATN